MSSDLKVSSHAAAGHSAQAASQSQPDASAFVDARGDSSLREAPREIGLPKGCCDSCLETFRWLVAKVAHFFYALFCGCPSEAEGETGNDVQSDVPGPASPPAGPDNVLPSAPPPQPVPGVDVTPEPVVVPIPAPVPAPAPAPALEPVLEPALAAPAPQPSALPVTRELSEPVVTVAGEREEQVQAQQPPSSAAAQAPDRRALAAAAAAGRLAAPGVASAPDRKTPHPATRLNDSMIRAQRRAAALNAVLRGDSIPATAAKGMSPSSSGAQPVAASGPVAAQKSPDDSPSEDHAKKLELFNSLAHLEMLLDITSVNDTLDALPEELKPYRANVAAFSAEQFKDWMKSMQDALFRAMYDEEGLRSFVARENTDKMKAFQSIQGPYVKQRIFEVWWIVAAGVTTFAKKTEFYLFVHRQFTKDIGAISTKNAERLFLNQDEPYKRKMYALFVTSHLQYFTNEDITRKLRILVADNMNEEFKIPTYEEMLAKPLFQGKLQGKLQGKPVSDGQSKSQN